MMKTYSAGLVSQSFWFIEVKKIVDLAGSGAGEDEIRTACLEHNLLGTTRETHTRRMYGYLINRLHTMDELLITLFGDADPATQKLINLIAMMRTDRLLLEFVYEVYREKALIGARVLTREDTNVFFTGKERESAEIAGWQDATKKKLGQCYLNFLTEAGLLWEDGKRKQITTPILDSRLQRYLESRGDTAIIKAITGAA